MGHRPYDYHPDHRYTGVLMDDAAVVVVAPFFVPDTTPTPRNPAVLLLLRRLRAPREVRADDRGRHRRVRGEEVAVRLGDAVAVRRQGLVAGPHAPRRPEDRRRAARVSAEPGQAAHGRRGRPVSRQAGGDVRRGARPQGRSTPRRFSWVSTAGRRRSKNSRRCSRRTRFTGSRVSQVLRFTGSQVLRFTGSRVHGFVKFTGSPVHCSRSASVGLMRVARRAGSQQATAATTASAMLAAESVVTSRGATP